MGSEKVIKGLEAILEETADMFYRSTIQDALALLKAQEPRVMTLEEVMARRGEPAWLEAKSSKGYKGYVLIYDVQEGMGITGVRIGVTKPGHITIWPAKELYGVKWRCWTAKPTEAQREETPWITCESRY